VDVNVGVIVGVFEAVGVGPVAVGKGPIRAPAVSAMAVLVLLALRGASTLSFGALKTIQDTINKPINRPMPFNACK